MAVGNFLLLIKISTWSECVLRRYLEISKYLFLRAMIRIVVSSESRVFMKADFCESYFSAF